jgi:hypothetical protein
MLSGEGAGQRERRGLRGYGICVRVHVFIK